MAKPQITTRHWQFLRALAQYGSIGAVARNEHHSETVVRRHLKDLSRACSVEVIDTSEGAARVTAAGMLLLERFAPIRDQQEFVDHRMRHLLTLREEDLSHGEAMARSVSG
ncbi:LysR family transcriptional regulator [Myceligenerans crystallogenes]|uniref:HTH lysR-type domain-containing protein n=1 Tax=Myceligenerans crystallogenes TaxID=316335 RepID=A0ABP4ZV72_9MICO